MLKDALWTPDDEDARAMYAYLEALSADGSGADPQPFTPVYVLDDPPAGDATSGATLYKKACASCHGAAHTGASRLVERASILPDQALAEHPLGKYTAAEQRLVFVEKTRHGGFVGYGGQMPPFSREALSDQDLGDLLAFFGLP
jgi:thiosulfate dehydrogenase